MKCEILTVGTELLLGEVVNTNAAYIGRRLAENGIECFKTVSVGDNVTRASEAIKAALKQSDGVIVTGGLGSTADDVTRDALAAAVGRPLKMSPSLKKVVSQRLKALDSPVNERTLSQAMLPSGAEPIIPTAGTAPGVILDNDGKLIFILPGVPSEMKVMLDGAVIPYIKKRFSLGSDIILSREIKIYGLKEAEVEARILPLIQAQANPTIGLLAGAGEVIVRLTARAEDREKAEDLIGRVESRVRDELDFYIYGADLDTMEGTVATLLNEQGRTLSCAESVTGGMVASRLVNIAGSSGFLAGGVIAYSNTVKSKLLEVSAQSLLAHGAVSAVVAEEMANGVRKRLGTDLGISSTGIAGPGGATEGKPVGLVYFGLSTRERLLVDHVVFSGDRNEIRGRAATHLLNMVRLYLLDRSGRGSETA